MLKIKTRRIESLKLRGYLSRFFLTDIAGNVSYSVEAKYSEYGDITFVLFEGNSNVIANTFEDMWHLRHACYRVRDISMTAITSYWQQFKYQYIRRLTNLENCKKYPARSRIVRQEVRWALGEDYED
jgi:hypothetical protein